ncbi:hypothetical protein [Paenibacillus ehimensis]|uniref:hypothetical protein n=1 Tax=Paenibacillus ehimensis TaxID=79264 RepID=UPI0013788ED8|nr:hypothetical protein [Paenibacillus ehimensis]
MNITFFELPSYPPLHYAAIHQNKAKNYTVNVIVEPLLNKGSGCRQSSVFKELT